MSWGDFGGVGGKWIVSFSVLNMAEDSIKCIFNVFIHAAHVKVEISTEKVQTCYFEKPFSL